MARRYLIGDVSRILGLARETLRYYERCGIVVPWKDPETGYRYYDPVQINHLMLCKMYRQMGMSSAEICDLIDREGSEGKRELLLRKSEELRREIQWKQMVLEAVERLEGQYEDFRTKVGNCYEEEQEAAAVVLHQWDDVFSRSRGLGETVHAWLSHTPVVYHAAFFERELLQRGECAIVWGFYCQLQQARELGLDRMEGVRIKEACRCLCRVVELREGERVGAEHFEPLLRQARERGLAIGDDAHGASIITGRVKGYAGRLQKLSLPVTEER